MLLRAHRRRWKFLAFDEWILYGVLSLFV
jgi:hypothetical protein